MESNASELVAAIPAKSRVRRYLLMLLLAGLAVYFFLPRLTAMQNALHTVSTLRIHFVVLALGAQLLSWFASGYMVSCIVRPAAKPVSIVDGTVVTTAANAVGTLGGGVFGTSGMTYIWLRQRGVNTGAAGLGGWLPIFLTNITLAVVSLMGLLVLAVLKKSSGVLAAGFTLAVLIVASAIASLIWSLAHRAKLEGYAARIAALLGRLRHQTPDFSKTQAAIRHLLEGWDAFTRGGWPRPILGSVLNTAFDMLTLHLLFLSAGLRTPVAVLVAGYGVPQLLGKFTVVLGGIGVVETSMVALYVLLNVPKEVAVIVVLAYRLISFWLPTVVGITLMPFVGGKDRGARAY